MNDKSVDQAVEALCHKGCKALWTEIERMESGEILPELRSLDETQRRQVLAEIKSIMAVYKGSCSL
ncbi:hypothetical protein [Thiolapillus sp.]